MATDLPLLYVRVRPQEDAAAAEYRSFLTATRLKEVDLDHLDLVRNPLPDDAFDRYSGFLIGGSPFNITDPDSTKNESQRRLEADLERIAARAAEARTAALFTCYGIGVVTRMLGGTVSRAWPEDTGPVAVALTREGQSDPLLGGLATRFTALTAHKEGAAEAPPGAVLLATNEACPVQAYRSGDTPLRHAVPSGADDPRLHRAHGDLPERRLLRGRRLRHDRRTRARGIRHRARPPAAHLRPHVRPRGRIARGLAGSCGVCA